MFLWAVNIIIGVLSQQSAPAIYVTGRLTAVQCNFHFQSLTYYLPSSKGGSQNGCKKKHLSTHFRVSFFIMSQFSSVQFDDFGSEGSGAPFGEPACFGDDLLTATSLWNSRPVRLIIIGGILLIGVTFAAAWVLLSNLRDQQISESKRGLESLAMVLAEQIDRSFQSIELVQTAVNERIHSLGIASAQDFKRQMSGFDAHQRLKEEISALPYVDAIVLTDPDGKLINFSRAWPIPSLKIPLEDPSKAFKSDPRLTVFVGNPLRSPATGSWVVPIARKLNGPNGELLGVVLGVIRLQYFERLFEAVAGKQNHSIALFSHDSTLIAGYRLHGNVRGQSFSERAIFKDVLSKSDYGTVQQASVSDGKDLLISGRNLAHYPLAVVITRTVDNALAGWRNASIYVIGAAVIIVFVIGGIAILSAWRIGKALHAQNRRINAALNNMSQGLVMFNSRGQLVVYNNRYIEMYGLSPQIVKPGCTLRELLDHRIEIGSVLSGDLDKYTGELRAALAQGISVNSVTKLSDGRVITISNRPMKDGGWVATHEDITEKMQKEISLRESEKRFSDLFEQSPDGAIFCDSRGQIKLANNEAYKIFGFDSGELIGQSVELLIPRDTQEKHVGLRNRYSQAPERRRMGANLADINGLRKDGSAFPADISISPINTASERMTFVTVRDVTERKQRDASFRLLFKNNPVPMGVYDLESLRFLAVNEAAIAHYGYSRDQFLAMTVMDIRVVEEHARSAEFVHTTKGTHDGEGIFRHQKSDGTVIDVTAFSRELNYEGRAAALVAVHDITKAKRAEDELRSTKKFIDTVIEHVPLPIIVKDVAGLEADARDSQFTLFNRAYEDLTGESRIELIGKTAHQIFPKVRADLVVRADNEALRSDKAVLTSEHPIYTSHNGTRLVAAKKTIIRGDDGKPQYLLTVVDDVTERRRAEQRISHLAQNDSLTGLPNRATFIECLAMTLDEASKRGMQFAILCVDLDRFKEANDVYGHLIGDGVLREVARRLQAAADGAFLARIGGDEFTLIVAGDSQPQPAEALGERLLAAFKDDFEVDGHRLQLSLSIGGAVYPTDGSDAKTLLANADAALYQAKSESRGSVRFFDAEMGARRRERRALHNDLRSAIECGELLLHYQPQLRMTGETVGFEALVRWQCPKRGMVSPGTFIPIAEESRLILPIGEWVLREACREAASWPQPLTIAVNISPVQFRHGDLARLVHSILLESGLAPARLELEITEGVLIDDFSHTVSILRRLKSLGVQIALDDFGTGYSSLSYLHSFTFDKLKIDRAFIGDLEHNRHSMAIVRAVIGLGKSFGIPTIAEGVETEAQHAFLVQESCDQVQGYLTGRPLPIADYAKRFLPNGKDAMSVVSQVV